MKEKILYWSMNVAGIICLFLYISSRYLPLMNLILVEKMDLELQEFIKYGDLYYNNCIAHFKEDFPDQIRRYRLSDKNPEMNNADILSYGDSFFDISFQETLPERLTDSLKQKVYSYITQDPTNSNPFCLLNEKGYARTDDPRIFILESAERNIPIKYERPYDSDCKKISVQFEGFFQRILNEYIFKYNDEQLFNLILKRSYLTYGIFSFYSTLKFDWFNQISSLTPLYRVSPDPWLFYSKSIDNGPGSFYYDFTPQEVNIYADNLARISKELRSNYNLEMIFMAIPNKYSLYSRIVSKDQYNGFIPALQEALDIRGVKYIDLYTPFSSSSDTLYFGTDTHWNKKGVDMALDITVNSIERLKAQSSSNVQIIQ